MDGLFLMNVSEDSRKTPRSRLWTRLSLALGGPASAAPPSTPRVASPGAGSRADAASPKPSPYADFTVDSPASTATPGLPVSPTQTASVWDSRADPRLASFLLQLVDLLTESSLGRQGGAEKRCQAVFPLRDALNVLRNLQGTQWRARTTLTRFGACCARYCRFCGCLKGAPPHSLHVFFAVFHVYMDVESTSSRGNRYTVGQLHCRYGGHP